MTEQLVIVGAGGFGREVLDVIDAINLEHSATGEDRFEALGFLDDGEPDTSLLAAYEVPHLGPAAYLSDLADDVGYVIGIGAPDVREKIDAMFVGRHAPVLIIRQRPSVGPSNWGQGPLFVREPG